LSGRQRSRGGSSSQTATCLLVILDVLGDPVAAESKFPDAVSVVSSLTRLEKMDFWVRNPWGAEPAQTFDTGFRGEVRKRDSAGMEASIRTRTSLDAPQSRSGPSPDYWIDGTG
jgi:hypothetical protein